MHTPRRRKRESRDTDVSLLTVCSMEEALRLESVLAIGPTPSSCGSSPTPVQVATDVTAVSAGAFHAMFLKADNTLRAVGDSERGQLGGGTTEDHFSPAQALSRASL
jgi:alpha-tubulin suppressor-like RCC1 family protein